MTLPHEEWEYPLPSTLPCFMPLQLENTLKCCWWKKGGGGQSANMWVVYSKNPGRFGDFKDRASIFAPPPPPIPVAQKWASLKCYESLTAIFCSFFIILWASFSIFFLCCSMKRFSLSAIFCCLFKKQKQNTKL